VPHHSQPDQAEQAEQAAHQQLTGAPASTIEDVAGPAAGPGRRGVVALAGAAALGVAGVASLAACGSGSSAGSATTPAASGGGAAAGSSSAAGSSAAAGGGALAKLADVPVGGAVAAAGPDGKPIIISQASAGTVTAVSALCTHAGCKVLIQNGKLDCPCHGSVFDLSGKVLKGPAATPLPAVAVKISGTDVVAG